MDIKKIPGDGHGFGSGRIQFFCLDPDPVFKFLLIRIRIRFQPPERKKSAESALKVMDPVCPERLDPDPVYIRPDPKP